MNNIERLYTVWKINKGDGVWTKNFMDMTSEVFKHLFPLFKKTFTL